MKSTMSAAARDYVRAFYRDNRLNLAAALALTVLDVPAALVGSWLLGRIIDVIGTGDASALAHLAALCGVFLQAASMAFVFPPLFKVFAQCFSADEQPILLSLTMPLAGLISAGGIPFFIGYCGEYYTFGLAFLTIAAMSVASAVSVAYLKNRE